jgi:hypothetical protein
MSDSFLRIMKLQGGDDKSYDMDMLSIINIIVNERNVEITISHDMYVMNLKDSGMASKFV